MMRQLRHWYIKPGSSYLIFFYDYLKCFYIPIKINILNNIVHYRLFSDLLVFENIIMDVNLTSFLKISN